MRVWIYTFKWPSYLSALFLGMIIVSIGYVYHQGHISEQVAHEEAFSFVIAEKVVVIDPGHGGADPGAGGSHGAVEKDITLDISLKLRRYLEQGGAKVIMIREDDRDLSTSEKGYSKKKREDLKNRVKMIKEANPDILVSIHVNSFPSNKWSGAQTFYNGNSEESKLFAEEIQQSLIDTMGNTTRKAKPIDAYILRNSDTTGALVEVGFISNPQEAKLMMDLEYQDKLALAIYEGINSYFSENNEL
ncbi:N-acetylmuramoyl-L-alanine amidase [Desulfitispora alkaliphila]|uniref:N-acetylmuramoyl-L-alanine amidase CwlD n=1 Tax=Desulfitispora alkaliphila TaxID=622674 RepID=UPI003D2069A5